MIRQGKWGRVQEGIGETCTEEADGGGQVRWEGGRTSIDHHACVMDAVDVAYIFPAGAQHWNSLISRSTAMRKTER